MSALEVLDCGPGASVQDAGRPGLIARGLSAGGALDPLALAEAAALLGVTEGIAAVEMPGIGGRFRAAGGDVMVALAGAPMRARIGERRLGWPGSHLLPEGAVLEIGPAMRGHLGYLSAGGGIATPRVLGARAAHLAAGIGRVLAPGDLLPLAPRPAGAPDGGQTLPQADRFSGGTLRLLAGPQTGLFPDAARELMETARFTKGAADRQGARLGLEGDGLATAERLSVTSDAIVPGDVQILGDGTPLVLLAECQTTGGYPRIGTVISADLPRVAQAPPGAELRFRFVTMDEALAARRAAAAEAAAMPRRLAPLTRDPADIPDLLAYQLIDGATSAHDPGDLADVPRR
jgi:allophanate hydrolase